MYTLARRASQKRLLQEFIEKREQLQELQAQMKVLRAQIAPLEEKLKNQFPSGIALDVGGGAAKIVEFVETERKTVNLQKVRALLGKDLPINTVDVSSVQIYDGVIS